MIKVRKNQPAFHPGAAMKVFDLHPSVFAVSRQREGQTIVALTNVSSSDVSISLENMRFSDETMDLLTGNRLKEPTKLDLGPYEYVWLTPIVTV
jgi:sucrose phosphorylase